MRLFEVVVSAKAKEDLVSNVEWWDENRSPERAARWYEGINQAMESLGYMPGRCTLVTGVDFGREVRVLRYGVRSKLTHRIYFGIEGDTVVVFRIRSMKLEELSGAADLA